MTDWCDSKIDRFTILRTLGAQKNTMPTAVSDGARRKAMGGQFLRGALAVQWPGL